MNRERRQDARGLVAAFRRAITRLLIQPWPPESPFVEGIRILVRQLGELERHAHRDVDDELMLELLPIVDALERARDHARRIDPSRVRMFDRAIDELVGVLLASGFHPERPLGAPFDPTRHEAVGTKETRTIPPNRVVEIMERGWFVGERQLRPSKVVVSKALAAA